MDDEVNNFSLIVPIILLDFLQHIVKIVLIPLCNQALVICGATLFPKNIFDIHSLIHVSSCIINLLIAKANDQLL
jgi:hypothetical protein